MTTDPSRWRASASSTTRWATSACPAAASGGPRPSGRSRTSRSPDSRSSPRMIARARLDQGRRPRRSTPSSACSTPTMATAIQDAAAEVARGGCDDQFPIDVFQTGSGTSSNMNMNEVLATLAGRAARPAGAPERPRQRVAVVSNDVFPSSIHVAATHAVVDDLIPALEHLAASLERKAPEFADVVKSGRTHLMDATPVTLGQEFGGYAAAGPLRRRAARGVAAPAGRAAARRHGGRHRHQHPARLRARGHRRAGRRHRPPLTEARDHFEAQGARDGLVETSGQLRTIAVGLYKIGNDLRWMGSGPRTGLTEIYAARPAARARRSCRARSTRCCPRRSCMVCAQVIGNDAADRLRRRGRQLRAQRHAAGARPQPARVDPAAGQRLPPARRPVRRRHRGRRGALPRVRRVLAVDRHAAEPLHRLRGGGQGRQAVPRRAQDDPPGRARARVRRATASSPRSSSTPPSTSCR